MELQHRLARQAIDIAVIKAIGLIVLPVTVVIIKRLYDDGEMHFSNIRIIRFRMKTRRESCSGIMRYRNQQLGFQPKTLWRHCIHERDRR